jgi:hypothetical protein
MTAPRQIIVLGPINEDVVVRAHRLPSAGETVKATSLTSASGGKGANQAVAAAWTDAALGCASPKPSLALYDGLVIQAHATGQRVAGRASRPESRTRP